MIHLWKSLSLYFCQDQRTRADACMLTSLLTSHVCAIRHETEQFSFFFEIHTRCSLAHSYIHTFTHIYNTISLSVVCKINLLDIALIEAHKIFTKLNLLDQQQASVLMYVDTLLNRINYIYERYVILVIMSMTCDSNVYESQ